MNDEGKSVTGKIIKGIAGFYYVHGSDSIVYECKAKGIFRNKKMKPLVGDCVEITVLAQEPPEGNIDEILPRKNTLIRPAVANIDQAFVMFAITDPEPNLNLLDRFLVLMEKSQIPVTLLFNKTDLADRETKERYIKIYEPAGYPIMFLSIYRKTGVETVQNYLEGKTTVLAGPSGVGKSSLINLLMPKANMETGSISEKIRRGKHTTRHSELFCLRENTYLMDTPGFSSVFVEDMEPGDLKEYFPEFKPFEDQCRFLGCDHMGENICGVKDAAKTGSISKSRYKNYRLFYEELKDKRRY